MRTRLIQPGEHDTWLRFRQLLWPDLSRESLIEEQALIVGDPEHCAVLLALDDEGRAAGFAEVSVREWAEGCASRPVGYLEAWYVEPSDRRKGVGRALIEAAERWAESKGCSEMGSDADLSNTVSHAAHAAIGFGEVGRQVLFSKRIGAARA